MLYEIEVSPEQEVIQTLEKRLFEIGIVHGAIVSLIGAVDSCCISNMPKSNAAEDILSTYEEPFELSGTGEIRNGKVHIHCVLGREDNSALAGHLHWAKVTTWYVRAYIIINNVLNYSA